MFEPVGRTRCGAVLAVALTSLLAWSTPVSAQPGARLSELPALARERNERQRPKVEATLAPYLKAFEMDYAAAANKAYLDRRFDEVAALGDSMVPALLERLTPSDDTPEARNIAANAARVLGRLGPAGFVAPLLQLVGGENSPARVHAVGLLGKSGHPEAARYLDAALPRMPKSALTATVTALRQLGHRPAATRVAALVSGSDGALRSACLEFLTELGSSADKASVLQALRAEVQDQQIPLYLGFLHKFGIGDGESAAALMPMLEIGRLPPPRQAQIIHALSVVAPKGHETTIARLRALISAGEIHEVGRSCASTLAALGDKTGRKLLFDQLDDEVRKNPKAALVLANRGDASLAFEQWSDAVRDYREALRHSHSPSLQKEVGLKLARCSVRVKDYRRAVQALRDAGASRVDLEAVADVDPTFKQALTDQADLRALVRDLNR